MSPYQRHAESLTRDILSLLETLHLAVFRQPAHLPGERVVLNAQEEEIVRVCQAGPLTGKAAAARLGRRFNSAFRAQLVFLVRTGYLTEPRASGGYKAR